jgi:hypothetical protein
MAACPLTIETLNDLRSQCPWYDIQTLPGTNVVVTACPKMLSQWRERAKQLGWSSE